jgi:hypothetical protein
MRSAAGRGQARRARSADHPRRRRSTCWPSRSSPRSPGGNGTRTSCPSAECAWPYRELRRRIRPPWCACSPTATRPAAAGAAPTCIVTPSTAACAPGAARALTATDQRRRDPGPVRLRRRAAAGGLPRRHVNEDFAFESMPGDIFQLGNTSYRILKIEPARCVEDAKGCSRRTSRSGSARRRGAATSSPPRSRLNGEQNRWPKD